MSTKVSVTLSVSKAGVLSIAAMTVVADMMTTVVRTFNDGGFMDITSMFANTGMESTMTTVMASVALAIASVMAGVMTAVMDGVAMMTTVTTVTGVTTISRVTSTMRATKVMRTTVMLSCLREGCEESECNSCLEHFLISNLFSPC